MSKQKIRTDDSKEILDRNTGYVIKSYVGRIILVFESNDESSYLKTNLNKGRFTILSLGKLNILSRMIVRFSSIINV